MDGKIKFDFGDFSLFGDISQASLIIGDQVNEPYNPREVRIHIDDTTKQYSKMSYTTDIDTMNLIINNMTLRSSCLSNAQLNDPMEKARVGIEQFASSKFISCFCHTDKETIPFWINYGKNIRKNKIQMVFNNFSSNFKNCFYTDYSLVNGNKKCFFKSPEFKAALNQVALQEYDLRVYIESLSIFDVIYVPLESEVFTKNNSGDVSVDFSILSAKPQFPIKMQGYDHSVLGKHKSDCWDYEKETRILTTLSRPDFIEYEYIDLRLKPEIFRDLIIVLSPWDDGSLRSKVTNILKNSNLPKDIIESIQINDSGLKNKLNFPE